MSIARLSEPRGFIGFGGTEQDAIIMLDVLEGAKEQRAEQLGMDVSRTRRKQKACWRCGDRQIRFSGSTRLYGIGQFPEAPLTS